MRPTAVAADVPAALNLAQSGGTPQAPTPQVKSDGKVHRRKPAGFGPWEIVKVVLGGAAGLGIGYLVVFFIQHRNPSEPKVEPRRTEPQRVVARTNGSDKLPEFRPVPEPSARPVAPVFVPPSIGFIPPSQAPSSPPPAVKNAISPGGRKRSAAQPPSPSLPLPGAPKQELDGLPPHIKLPPLVDTTALALCPLHVPAGQTLDVAINAAAANLPAEATLLVDRSPEVAARWVVLYVPDVNDAAAEKKTLAELTHSGGELRFLWRTPIEDAPARKELANCLLSLTCGNVSKSAFLRTADEIPRLDVDLDIGVAQLQLPVLDPPKDESLRLELVELSGFPGGARVRDDRTLLKLKERTTIEFEQFPGAEIQLEFRRHPTGDLQIVMRPEFRENAAERMVMTLPRLADLKKGLEKAIPEGEAKLVALGKEAESIEDQLRRLGGRPNGAAFVAWQVKRTQLESALSSCKSQASRLARRLPEMKLRLSVVPKMEQFLGKLHRQGSLRIRVVAECGDARLTIIDARLDPPTDS